MINQYSDLNFRQINKEVRLKAASIHQKALEAMKTWESESGDLQTWVEHSNHLAVQSVNEWWDLAWKLIAKCPGMRLQVSDGILGVPYRAKVGKGTCIYIIIGLDIRPCRSLSIVRGIICPPHRKFVNGGSTPLNGTCRSCRSTLCSFAAVACCSACPCSRSFPRRMGRS